MANGRGGLGGLTLGGGIVIAGIVIAIFWSLLWGIIVALIGLVAFGGFARGRWYRPEGYFQPSVTEGGVR
jgi:hypothetical protein